MGMSGFGRTPMWDFREKELSRNGHPPEDLEGSQHGGNDVAHGVDLGRCGQRDLDRPGETQDHIFYDGTVVVGLDAECGKGDDKEGGRIFPSIHQALNEAEPGGQTLDDGPQTVGVAVAYVAVRLKDVVADEILQVHQNNHQRVELISQPEVCELHPVERCCDHAELETGNTDKRAATGDNRGRREKVKTWTAKDK
ncbi:hypothetical protein EYF80_000562 [Liparis tanakae]|uniref:Uncharacterized protein n=1 Tax=Liparis tanakae TaxID=230148 RepID=A0A4Z2JHQ4_9TELE|nr:hypothetical protein EYF80_000562 [Liparis tanakae]